MTFSPRAYNSAMWRVSASLEVITRGKYSEREILYKQSGHESRSRRACPHYRLDRPHQAVVAARQRVHRRRHQIFRERLRIVEDVLRISYRRAREFTIAIDRSRSSIAVDCPHVEQRSGQKHIQNHGLDLPRNTLHAASAFK
jgi:hypothetical protein